MSTPKSELIARQMTGFSLSDFTRSERRALLDGDTVTISLKKTDGKIFDAGSYPKRLMLAVSDISKFSDDETQTTFTLQPGTTSTGGLVRVLDHIVSSCNAYNPFPMPPMGQALNDLSTYFTALTLGLKDIERSIGDYLVALVRSRQLTSMEFTAFFNMLPDTNRVIANLVHVTAWHRRDGRLTDEGIKAKIESHPGLRKRLEIIDRVNDWQND